MQDTTTNVKEAIQERMTHEYRWLKRDGDEEGAIGAIDALSSLAFTLGLDQIELHKQAKADSGYNR